MSLWQRLLGTIAAVVVVSFLAGWGFDRWFGITLPSYAAGLVGGVSALPVWELLKRLRAGR